PLPGARELAAVLTCDSRAFAGARSAAALWGMIEPTPGPVEVLVVGRECRSRDNLVVHSIDALDVRDRDTVRGIPVTSPARTLIDFAAEAEDDELEAAVSEGRALKLIRDGDLERAIERTGRRKGVARVRALLRSEGDNGYTRSKAERIMRRLARQA